MLNMLLIGTAAGLVMGTVGVGGGAIIISCLTLFAGFPQKTAQGTTLFVVAAPVSLLAALRYHREGHVDIAAGLILMLAFLFSSYAGAHFAGRLPDYVLKALLGVMLVCMGAKLVLSSWGGYKTSLSRPGAGARLHLAVSLIRSDSSNCLCNRVCNQELSAQGRRQ